MSDFSRKRCGRSRYLSALYARYQTQRTTKRCPMNHTINQPACHSTRTMKKRDVWDKAGSCFAVDRVVKSVYHTDATLSAHKRPLRTATCTFRGHLAAALRAAHYTLQHSSERAPLHVLSLYRLNYTISLNSTSSHLAGGVSEWTDREVKLW
jgi:hypothetical protein